MNLKLELAMNLLIFVCSLFGAVYGLNKFFKKKKALYLKLVTCGIMSLMFSRLYQSIYMLTQGTLNQGFQIGILGIIGSFMFFFSANFGQIDGLVDDKTKTFTKTRIISLAAPLLILFMYLFFFMRVRNTELKIVYGVVSLFIMQCAYYSFKHIIIYDVDFGIVKCLRSYNLLVLIYAVAGILEPAGLYLGVMPLYITACAVTAIIALILLPVLKGGAQKWTI